MKKITLSRLRPFRAVCTVPGDKSIAHRTLLLGALAGSRTRIQNLPMGQDVCSTITCLRQLGVPVYVRGIAGGNGEWEVDGSSPSAWREPLTVLNAGNSGTTVRLLMGASARLPFTTVWTGDASLVRRSLAAVVRPLRRMGARIEGRGAGEYLPLSLRGGSLQGITTTIPQASAQTKGCLLLAGLHAEGVTRFREGLPTRDHTERMLPTFGGLCGREGDWYVVPGGQVLSPATLWVPGDISSAAFLLATALLTKGGHLRVNRVGLNPYRTGFLRALLRMGARLHVTVEGIEAGEPWGSITISSSSLVGVDIEATQVSTLLDELPLLAVLATQAEGVTSVAGAWALRGKETDRLAATTRTLRSLGAEVEERRDGWVICGPTPLYGCAESWGDHRLAMAWAVAGCSSQRGITIRGIEAAAVSFPGFFDILRSWG
ncbi:3-phosphoshikimate 1-carboxyvinyltransferase [Pasteuria penetrans]|uniref:3-phosphoshikimate 1-carboxyvinyltransferase n=1 Tax=Pasteuria penetrans TaxID=86005 RepID=UPI000FB7029D|nr:3-phosphoshikimate 1-carboxyvinyltransferase [Pasteuria penetrans]